MTSMPTAFAVMAIVFAAALLGCQNPAPVTPQPPPENTATPMAIGYTRAPDVAAETPAVIKPSPSPTTAPTSTARAIPTETPPEAAVTDGPLLTEVMQSRRHFPRPSKFTDIFPTGYNTVPPTSGPHWSQWSNCGFFTHHLPDELLVHNLEHGNIIVSYNFTDAARTEALRAALSTIPLAEEFAIARRYDAIPEGMVAITAWGVLDRMMGVDSERIAKFFRDYPGNTGPEFPNGLPCTTGIDLMQSSGS